MSDVEEYPFVTLASVTQKKKVRGAYRGSVTRNIGQPEVALNECNLCKVKQRDNL